MTPADKLTALMGEFRKQFPDFRVKYKSESWLMKTLGVLLYPFNPGFMYAYTTVLGDSVYFPSRDFQRDFPRRSFMVLAHELIHRMDSRDHKWFSLSYLFPQVLCLIPLVLLLVLYPVCTVVTAVALVVYFLVSLKAVSLEKPRVAGVALASCGLGLAVLCLISGLWSSLLGAATLVLLLPWPAPYRAQWELRGYAMNLAIPLWEGTPVDSDTLVESVIDYFLGPDYYFMCWSGRDVRKRVSNLIDRASTGLLVSEHAGYRIVYDLVKLRP